MCLIPGIVHTKNQGRWQLNSDDKVLDVDVIDV